MQVSSIRNPDTGSPSAIWDLVTKIPDVGKALAGRTEKKRGEFYYNTQIDDVLLSDIQNQDGPITMSGSSVSTTCYTEDLLLCIKALENRRLPIQTTDAITKPQPDPTNSPCNPA